MHKEDYVLSLSGIQFKVCHKIVDKLNKVGATSMEKAVTIEEAGLDLQEQDWLIYLAGGFLGEIKKAEDKRYYV